MDFEWDPKKAQANLDKHGIDFEDAIGIFEDPVLALQSNRNNEQRWKTIGELNGIIIAVAYTMRGERCRIISARRANRNERKAYREAYPGESEEGTD